MSFPPAAIAFTVAGDDSNARMESAIHIICPVYNGARFLEAFVASVQQQTVSNWVLWTCDDGSGDGSPEVMRVLGARDERIRVLDSPGTRMGVVGSFNYLLHRVPAVARYIMFADQDDSWLPIKIEYTLKAMYAVEESFHGAVLAHSDMIVVNEALQEIDPSFWHFARIDPEMTSLRQLATNNVVTGATVMLNRALRERIGSIPPQAVMHDAWTACVAGAFGKIVAISTPTMLYRQHNANTVGAHRPASASSPTGIALGIASSFRRSEKLHTYLDRLARQAAEFVRRYGNDLSAGDRDFLSAYSRIPERGFIRRKLEIFRLHVQGANGWLRNIGWILRG